MDGKSGENLRFAELRIRVSQSKKSVVMGNSASTTDSALRIPKKPPGTNSEEALQQLVGAAVVGG